MKIVGRAIIILGGTKGVKVAIIIYKNTDFSKLLGARALAASPKSTLMIMISASYNGNLLLLTNQLSLTNSL